MLAIATACMNRNEHLREVLPTWLQVADELVICDWGSSTHVIDTVKQVLNSLSAQSGAAVTTRTITVLRAQNVRRWILSPAFNIAIRYTTSAQVLKLDCDDVLKPGFREQHALGVGEFRCGDWRLARNDQENYLNGVVMFNRDDFIAAGRYNEYITTYGWDDSDLYARLETGCKRLPINNDLIEHLPHGARSDTTNTYVEIQYNRLLCNHMHAKDAPEVTYTANTICLQAIQGINVQYMIGEATLRAHVPSHVRVETLHELHDMLAYTRPELVNRLYINLQNGLGNKLRAMASGYGLYQWLKYRSTNKLRWVLTFIWPIDEHCEAAHDDLFTVESLTQNCPQITFTQNIPHEELPIGSAQDVKPRLLQQVSAISTLVSADTGAVFAQCVGREVSDVMIYRQDATYDFDGIVSKFGPATIYIETANVINFPQHLWEDDAAYLRALVPAPRVQKALDATLLTAPVGISQMIGLHIRIGQNISPDNTDGWSEDKRQQWARWRSASSYENFTRVLDQFPNDMFYVASDSQEVYDRLADKYAQQIYFQRRTLFDRSCDQVITGLVDAIALSKTKAFYGSNWSSFSELVARLGSKNNKYAGKDW